MSTTRTTQGNTPHTSAGPGRFVPQGPPPERTSAVTRIGAALALAAIVIGVPALLFWLSGPPPIPTRLPVREDFTSNLGVQQLLTVLVAIVWIAWLQFVVCVAVEMISAVRNRGLPAPVPLSGPSQRLARVLVGALLLTSVASGTVASVVNAVSPGPARADTSVSAVSDVRTPNLSPTAGPTAGPMAMPTAAPTAGTWGDVGPPPQVNGQVNGQANGIAGQVPLAAPTASANGSANGTDVGHTPLVAAPAVAGNPQSLTPADPHNPALTPGTKYYVVQLPVGHHHDSLWEIAERHLGDGKRYKEIYELNKDRIQPDGKSLHLARLIYAGWDLVMPADAVGVNVVAAPATAPGVPVAPVIPVQPADPNAPALNGARGVEGGGLAVQVQGQTLDRAVGDRAVAAPTVETNPLVAALSVGGIFAACVLIALQRVRRRNNGGTEPAEDGVDAEVGLLAGADLTRARFVDEALRSLATRCEAAGIPLPTLYAARADDDDLSLLLAPPRTDAPDPWAVHDDGRRWTLRREYLGRGRSGGPAAYPALVSLGRDDDGYDVFVDLEATDGPVQVTGDPVVAGEFASAVAVQLATSPWSDEVRVSCVGLPPALAEVAESEIDIVPDVAGVIARLEQGVAHGRADVLSGRLARAAGAPPEYAVLATPVDEDEAIRIGSLLAGGRHAVGVVAVGPVPGSQWQVTVDDAGRLSVPLLGLTVQAHRLNERGATAVADLFTAARTAPRPVEDGSLRTVPVPGVDTDDGAFAIAPVRLTVLGPVSVRTAGPLDPSRTDIAEELVCYLALHPGGVHPAVLASAVWPRGVSDPVAAATVARVRDWLGTDTDGSARLRTDETGRLSLGPSVVCDWTAFCVLVQRARQAHGPLAETDLLRRALRLVRGAAFEDHPVGRYSWLPRTGLVRAIGDSVVQVSHRLVELGRTGSDPDGAASATVAGLRLARDSQLLWRDVLEIEYDRRGPAACEEAEVEMRRTLEELGVPVEPETDALLEHLLGRRGEPAAHA